MKRILAIILSFFLSFPAFAEKPTEAWVMCQPDSEVIVRMTANRHSREIARVFPGDHILLTGKKSGRWYQVDIPCEMGIGWVRGDFLSFTEPEVFEGGKWFESNRKRLVARYSIKGRVRKKFTKKVRVKVYLMAEEWSVTSQGYIMTRFLEAVE